jgi:AraC family transcriptional regulator of adaptative response/methylated-DNA-[protein]-cysteine methyltransferase
MKTLIDSPIHNNETYNRMAQAILFMRQNYHQQPDLATIAQQVHLSEYHFQRLFTQWAGVSPKRFLQYLTLEYAKTKISETKNLLELTTDAGLSSPGRLHDLFVKLEAMSPGEFKAGGRGLTICYGIHPTPFGRSLIATIKRGICNLHFLDSDDEDNAVKMLNLAWPNATLQADQKNTQSICDRIFQPPKNQTTPLVLWVKGTNFQIQVWRALLHIPLGGITTYGDLASAIDRPGASRAVGNAVGQNPIGYLIPCHRVIRESGALGGYRWGAARKATLLGWEASQITSEEDF